MLTVLKASNIVDFIAGYYFFCGGGTPNILQSASVNTKSVLGGTDGKWIALLFTSYSYSC